MVAFGRIQLNVIMINCISGIEPDDTPGLEPLVLNDLLKHRLCIFKQLPGLLTDCFIVKDLWVCAVRVLSSYLPALEEGVPIYVGYELFEVVLDEHLCAEERRLHNRHLMPVSDF